MLIYTPALAGHSTPEPADISNDTEAKKWRVTKSLLILNRFAVNASAQRKPLIQPASLSILFVRCDESSSQSENQSENRPRGQISITKLQNYI